MTELNGRPVTPGELAALALYNYGHFTTMRVEEMRVRGLSLHLDRLLADCRILHGVDLDLDRVRHLVRRAAASAPSPVIVRVTVFDPEFDRAHPAAKARPEILVGTRPVPAGQAPPALGVVEYERDMPEVKHSGLFGPLLHRRFAQINGYDDVLFVNRRAQVTEGPTWNIGFVRNGGVVWPESDHLNGVTMRLLDDALRRAGIPSRTTEVDTDDLASMGSAFITDAAFGPRPVRSIEGVELSLDEPILTTLRREYAAIPGDPL
ncbi:aminotransferase class IV family protein [Sphaerisporangium perillae]|uniref:aminotransferase class IV family protein n=1 Tax=Sphaerisporangium perillae TaxID=2935860 RepID=UPI00200E267A|nr:aminotransferase class IV family protein [Sphaerisporangium perillae]